MSRILLSLIAGAVLAMLATAPSLAGGCCLPPLGARPVVIPAPPVVVQTTVPAMLPVSVPAPVEVIAAPVPLCWVDQGPHYSGPGSDFAPRPYHANKPVRDFPYISTVAPAYDDYPPYRHPRYPRHGGLRVRG